MRFLVICGLFKISFALILFLFIIYFINQPAWSPRSRMMQDSVLMTRGGGQEVSSQPGLPGPKGEKGDPGANGEHGLTGRPGDKGELGYTGSKGDKGSKVGF